MELAHGLGGRTDLPVPVWMAAYGAAAALVVSFAALGVFWRSARLESARWGPVVADGDSFGTRTVFVVTRVFGVALFALVLSAALFGDDTSLDNIAPVSVYVIFWVGLTIVCGLVGDAYALLDPFDTLGGGLDPLDPEGGRYTLGMWPAAAGLFGFVWLELVYPDGAKPRVLAIALIVYGAAMLAGSARWGRVFLREGHAFRVWFGLLGAMGVLGVDGRGRVRWRWPLVGLASLPTGAVPGLVAVVCVALGSTGFDGLSRTAWWADVAGSSRLAMGTLGLVAAIAAVAGLYLGAMWMADRLTGGQGGGVMALAGSFVHSLVPIAFAYAVAHYVSLLVFEGQSVVALASDPFGVGWDLFGTADRQIDFTVVSTRVISYVQVASIVLGHIAGVVLAHDRALALFGSRGRAATRSQYPLLAMMVVFTVAGLLLLLGG